MKLIWSVVVLCVIQSIAFGQVFNKEKAMIRHINKVLKPKWTAGENERFSGMTDEDKARLLGSMIDEASKNLLPTLYHESSGNTVPSSFDARQKWPMCKSTGTIRDQSQCGSCWAFGAVEAMSDRICIFSKGKYQPNLSADDLLACCGDCSHHRCHAGYMDKAWQYWVHTGIVTGSNYTLKQGCRPYPFPPCGPKHPKGAPPCPKGRYFPNPKCVKKCESSYPKSYDSDKWFGKSAYKVSTQNLKNVQLEIEKNGPVETFMNVYKDFYVYKTGVYHYVWGRLEGGHAVKIFGWGEENGTPYWLVANSWDTTWGDNGVFKILRGSNECQIESFIVAGIPKLPGE